MNPELQQTGVAQSSQGFHSCTLLKTLVNTNDSDTGSIDELNQLQIHPLHVGPAEFEKQNQVKFLEIESILN